MSKLKKALLIFTASCFGLVSVVSLITFIIGALSLAAFVTLFSIGAVACAVMVGITIYLIKKAKAKAQENAKTQEQTALDPTTISGMAGIYAVLGIPLQYNPDGSIKDIYELLGIEPEYDENGNRIETIYEKLGISPKFDQNGNERPSVVVIKNGVKKIAKVDLSTRILIRKLSEQEKEEMVINETLQRKLKEAEQSGDTKQQQAITKIITEKKQQKETKYSPTVFKLGKFGGKSISTSSMPAIKNDYIIPVADSLLAGLFAASAMRHPTPTQTNRAPATSNDHDSEMRHTRIPPARRPAPTNREPSSEFGIRFDLAAVNEKRSSPNPDEMDRG